MRFGWPIILCPLEDSVHLSLPLWSDALCHNRLKLLIVAVNIWGKPERNAQSVAAPYGCLRLKRARSKSLEQSRRVK